MKVDMDANIDLVELTQKETLKAINSISGNLNMTLETFGDFETNWLPTLDFEIGVEEGLIQFRFFEKSMRSKWVTPAHTATTTQNKINWLSNDLVRRLLRVEDVLLSPKGY